MDWPEGLQAGESFSKERDSFPADTADRARSESEARSTPQESRPPRPPAPPPSLLKPCLHRGPSSRPPRLARSARLALRGRSVVSRRAGLSPKVVLLSALLGDQVRG